MTSRNPASKDDPRQPDQGAFEGWSSPHGDPGSTSAAEDFTPESERTVYTRVPEALLERAREAQPSEFPPPSYDDGDRTVIFAPPRELLTQSLPEAGAEAVPTVRPPSPELPSETSAPEVFVTAGESSAPPSLPRSSPRGRRKLGVAACVLALVLAAAALAYLHSGRALFMPFSPLKLG